LVFQTVVASLEEARPAELGNGHRTNFPADAPKHSLSYPSEAQDLTQAAPDHLGPEPPRPLPYRCSVHPVSRTFTGLWDGYSTPVCGGCQDAIPIYCIV